MYLKCSPTWEFFFYGLRVLGPQACSHVGDHGPHVGMQVHNVFLKATLVSHQQHVNVLLVWVS
jgi:FMN phosphatase YigB (HAD superfamily)